DEPVAALRPRLGQARPHLLARQRPHERVVDRVHDAERRDLWRRGRRIEPARRQRDVERDGDVAGGLGGCGGGGGRCGGGGGAAVLSGRTMVLMTMARTNVARMFMLVIRRTS